MKERRKTLEWYVTPQDFAQGIQTRTYVTEHTNSTMCERTVKEYLNRQVVGMYPDACMAFSVRSLSRGLSVA